MITTVADRVVWLSTPKNAIWLFRFYEYVADVYWFYNDLLDRRTLIDFVDIFTSVNLRNFFFIPSDDYLYHFSFSASTAGTHGRGALLARKNSWEESTSMVLGTSDETDPRSRRRFHGVVNKYFKFIWIFWQLVHKILIKAEVMRVVLLLFTAARKYRRVHILNGFTTLHHT